MELPIAVIVTIAASIVAPALVEVTTARTIVPAVTFDDLELWIFVKGGIQTYRG